MKNNGKSNELDLWNRKECSPDETIIRIRSILSKYGIPTSLTAEYDYKELWYSNRLELLSTTFIGSNGKGVSREYAIASAYGEFMERIQSKFLLNGLFFRKFEPSNNNKQISSMVLKKLHSRYTNLSDLSNAISKYETVKYNFVPNGKEINLPDIYINLTCGSNGLASGNTFAEAFCQGTCEIFERYVVREIYYGTYDVGTFRRVDESLYRDTKSFTMIEAIRSKGYSVTIIDCTLGNRLPVLGILLQDPTLLKYHFRLASDINLDICLQRCITEIFQGINFDLRFRLHMNREEINYSGTNFWNNINIDQEYTRTIIDGTGKLPKRFFLQQMQHCDTLTIFSPENMTNDEAAKHILLLAKQWSNEVYVANLTKLGFPTIRIFIPGLSECFYYDKVPLDKVFNLFSNLKKNFMEDRVFERVFLDELLLLVKMYPYTYNFNLTKVFGILVRNVEGSEFVYDVDLLIALLSCLHGERELVLKHAKKYCENSNFDMRKTFIVGSTLDAIVSDIKLETFCKYMTMYSINAEELTLINSFYSFITHGFPIKGCANCNNCYLREDCLIDEVKRIVKIIDTSPEPLVEEYAKFLENLKS